MSSFVTEFIFFTPSWAIFLPSCNKSVNCSILITDLDCDSPVEAWLIIDHGSRYFNSCNHWAFACFSIAIISYIRSPPCLFGTWKNKKIIRCHYCHLYGQAIWDCRWKKRADHFRQQVSQCTHCNSSSSRCLDSIYPTSISDCTSTSPDASELHISLLFINLWMSLPLLQTLTTQVNLDRFLIRMPLFIWHHMPLFSLFAHLYHRHFRYLLRIVPHCLWSIIVSWLLFYTLLDFLWTYFFLTNLLIIITL